jgi:hypothetical protein
MDSYPESARGFKAVKGGGYKGRAARLAIL